MSLLDRFKQTQTGGDLANKLSDLLSKVGLNSLLPGTQIGSFGDVIFTCSYSTVRTFSNYQRSTSARYATHELMCQRSVLEYLGYDLEEISFDMTFLVSLGVNPVEEANRLRELCINGDAQLFVVGGMHIGNGLWVITKVGENNTDYDGRGNMLKNTVSVTIKEVGGDYGIIPGYGGQHGY